MSWIDEMDMLVADWDETVTSKDTMALVADAAYKIKPSFEPKWQYFVDAYMADYKRYVGSETSNTRTTIEQERKFLAGLDAIEKASFRRVVESGLFEGVPESALTSQSTQVPIRSGWWKVLDRMRARRLPVAIVSVNWSAALIYQVLADHGFGKDDGIEVFANEVRTNSGGIHTAVDKLEIVKQLHQHNQKIAYFGDSNTDLLSLIEADRGVVVANRKTFDKIAALGVPNLRFIRDWAELIPNSSLHN